MSLQNRKVEAKASVMRAPDGFFLFMVILLTFIGLVMLFSASSPRAYAEGDVSGMKYVIKQGRFVLVGLFAMFGIAFFAKIHAILKSKFIVGLLYLIGLGLLVLVFTPLGVTKNGCTRWLNIGFDFQPSEVIKFVIPLVLAKFFQVNYDKIRSAKFINHRKVRECDTEVFDRELKPGFMFLFAPFKFVYKYIWLAFGDYTKYNLGPFILAGLPILMIMQQPHMSCTIILLSITLVCIFVGNMKMHHLLALAAIAVVAILIIGFTIARDEFGYIFDRLANMGNKGGDLLGDNWQSTQSQIAIGSGGLTGLGFTNSRQKYLFLPEPHNDFIFSIVCEELGLIGATFIIFLFIGLIYRGFYIASKQTDRFSMILCTGIITHIAIQTILNIIVVTGIINTGISLPFFSYGGTALLMQLAEMGVVLHYSRFVSE
jgi:cell division protein FtsW